MAYEKLDLKTGDRFTAGNLGHIESALSEVISSDEGKAPLTTLDTRIPSGLALRIDTTVGTRIFAGNTMIHGDTGWRAIVLWGKDGSLTGELPTGITAQSENGGIYYRRINGTVTLRILAARAESTNFQIPIPTGFAPGGAPWPVVALSIANSSVSPYVRVGASYAYAGVTGASASNPVNLPSSGPGYSSEATWGTDRAWPTSLPGLPA